jgi:hypothetical protein
MWGRKGELGGNDVGRIGCGGSGLNEDYPAYRGLKRALPRLSMS